MQVRNRIDNAALRERRKIEHKGGGDGTPAPKKKGVSREAPTIPKVTPGARILEGFDAIKDRERHEHPLIHGRE